MILSICEYLVCENNAVQPCKNCGKSYCKEHIRENICNICVFEANKTKKERLLGFALFIGGLVFVALTIFMVKENPRGLGFAVIPIFGLGILSVALIIVGLQWLLAHTWFMGKGYILIGGFFLIGLASWLLDIETSDGFNISAIIALIVGLGASDPKDFT